MLNNILKNPAPISEDNARYAAVLLPLILKDKRKESEIREALEKDNFNPSDFELLFEVRSSKLDTQPGDICFPGGLIGIKGAEETGKAAAENAVAETAEEAAVRECCEELLVDESQIEIIGPADYFHRENLVIYPYLGILKGYEGGFNRDEVSETFTVPLEFFFENEPVGHNMEWVQAIPEDFPVEKIYGGRNYKFRKQTEEQFFWEYEGRIIWGISAKMLRQFVIRIREYKGQQ